MNRDILFNNIKVWAEKEPYIHRCWAYGSLIKGGFSEVSSDIDIAIEMFRKPGDESFLPIWFECKKHLNDGLKAATGENTHIEAIDDAKKGVVAKAVADHGILIYEREIN